MAAGGPERRRRRETSTSSGDGAQQSREEGPDATQARRGARTDAASRPDVYVDVPKLEVDHIGLEVENLRARVSLQAEVLDLLKLNVGVDAELGRVALEIDGVQAEATLKVRLDEVAGIIDRVLDTVDRNPQILETVARTAQSAVQEVGSGVGEAAGQVGRAAGDAVGEVAGQAGGAVGQLTDQAGEAVGQVTDQAGEAVGQVTDQAGEAVGDATGAVEEVAGEAGEAAGDTAGDAAGTAADTTEDSAGTDEDTAPDADRETTDEARDDGDAPDPGETLGRSGDDSAESDDATPARARGSSGRSRRSSSTRSRPARRTTG